MISLSVYDINFNFIRRLPEWVGCSAQQEMNHPGAMALTLPRHGVGVDELLDMNDAIIRVDEDGHDSVDFIFDAESEDQATDDGDVSLGCPGHMQILERAVVYPRYGVGNYPNHSFPEKTVGFIVKTLVDLAKSRGALPGLTYNFTATHDSAGIPWRFLLDVNYDAGVNLLDLATGLADNGWCDIRVQDGILEIYNPNAELGRALLGQWNIVWRTGTTYGAGDVFTTENTDYIDKNLTGVAPQPAAPFNFVARATINVTEEGTQKFRVTTDDGAQLVVNGSQILATGANAVQGAPAVYETTKFMEAGTFPIELRYFLASGSGQIKLEYAAPEAPYDTLNNYAPVIVRRTREVTSAPRKKQRSTQKSAVLIVGLDGKNTEVVNPIPGLDYRSNRLCVALEIDSSCLVARQAKDRLLKSICGQVRIRLGVTTASATISTATIYVTKVAISSRSAYRVSQLRGRSTALRLRHLN